MSPPAPRPAAVKGVTRRVVVVPSPDPAIFEQAVFILRDDFLHSPGVSQEALLRQAREAAGLYVSASVPPRRPRLRPLLLLAGGLLLAAALAALLLL